jgi:type II secretory ATPase GspE/PulE/Tfp pilus assembly ATPase PilB-like protein
MATDKPRLIDPTGEAVQAQAVAARYRCEFVDLREGSIDHDLFRSIPVDLMFRYNFVPLQAQNGTLDIALADPRNLNTIDELALLLNKKLRVKVATLSQISDLLKKTEQSQRVLEEVTEGFTLDVVATKRTPTKRSPSTSSPPSIATSRRSSSWSIPPSSTRSSGAPAISTSNRATRKWPSSTASTACCTTPCRPSPRTGTPPSFRASRS